jgi:hypothetical protein
MKSKKHIFSIYQDIVLGEACELNFKGHPIVPMVLDAITINAPCPNFAIFSKIDVGDFPLIEEWMTDAFALVPNTACDSIEMQRLSDRAPEVSKEKPARAVGQYTGLVPEGCETGAAYTIYISFQGAVTGQDTEIAD